MDRTGFGVQNALMRRSILILLVVLTANFLSCQQPETTSPESKTIGHPAGTRPSDPATLASAIRGSYYHPDGMYGLDCSVSVNWPAFFAAMKLSPPAERLKAIQGLNIRSQAIRGKSPNITFEWTGGVLSNKEQFEDGLRQMLGGYYQMYWSLLASPLVDNAADITKIEPLPDGGARVYSSSENSNVVINVDKENTPTHYTLDTPALKGTVDLRYIPAPKPVAGDLRRISGMDVSAQIGTSIMNVKLDLDYQVVDGFYVPGHVSYDVGGAYSLSTEFSGCSISKGPIADKIR